MLAFVLCSCENSREDLDRYMGEQSINKEKATDVEILYSDSAIVRVRILAPLMYTEMNPIQPKQEFPDGIHVDFIDERKRVQTIITAKRATRRERDGIIVLRDSVRVLNKVARELLETNELTWDERQSRISSKAFVKITRPGEVLTGYGFTANQDFTEGRILKPKGNFPSDGFIEGIE